MQAATAPYSSHPEQPPNYQHHDPPKYDNESKDPRFNQHGYQPNYPPPQPNYQQPGHYPNYPPPQPGYPNHQPGYPPQQPITVMPVPITAPPAPTNNVTNVTVNTQSQGGGSCPVCHAGHFETSFTCCGWLCCILFFPVGIICCCCCMRQKKCNHCGFTVG